MRRRGEQISSTHDLPKWRNQARCAARRQRDRAAPRADARQAL